MFKASRMSQGFSVRNGNPHCPFWEGGRGLWIKLDSGRGEVGSWLGLRSSAAGGFGKRHCWVAVEGDG